VANQAKQETSRSRRRVELNLTPASVGFFLALPFDPEEGGDMLLGNVGRTHGVKTQKSELSIGTALLPSIYHTTTLICLRFLTIFPSKITRM
jgi:hypothetical protein